MENYLNVNLRKPRNIVRIVLLDVPFVDRIPYQIDRRYIVPTLAECCIAIRKAQYRTLGILTPAMASLRGDAPALRLIIRAEQKRARTSASCRRNALLPLVLANANFLKSRY